MMCCLMECPWWNVRANVCCVARHWLCTVNSLTARIAYVHRDSLFHVTVLRIPLSSPSSSPAEPLNSGTRRGSARPSRPIEWRSRKFSTEGASICSVPFCPFPFSCPTESAVQSKKRHDISTYHTAWMIERTMINSYITKSNTKKNVFSWQGVRTPFTLLVWLRHCKYRPIAISAVVCFMFKYVDSIFQQQAVNEVNTVSNKILI